MVDKNILYLTALLLLWLLVNITVRVVACPCIYGKRSAWFRYLLSYYGSNCCAVLTIFNPVQKALSN